MHEEVRALLAERPDDLEVRRVFADALQVQGDPHGGCSSSRSRGSDATRHPGRLERLELTRIGLEERVIDELRARVPTLYLDGKRAARG